MNIDKVLVWQNFFAVLGHRAHGVSNKCLDVFNGFGIWCQFRTRKPPLPNKTMTLPTPVLNESGLAFFGRASRRANALNTQLDSNKVAAENLTNGLTY